MAKLNVGIIFGGVSSEHDVSRVSAESIIKNYTEIKYLSHSDMYYIISYIAFPQKYWKISRDYYKNVSKCNKNSFKTLLNDAISKTETQYEFILQFIDYIQTISSHNIL